jgi:hypothetical protein
MKMPYCKFFPRDWLSDLKLRGCCLAARGLWADMLCLMAQSDRRGHLEVGGKPMRSDDLARRIGERPGEVKRLLAELKAAGVFSRERGVIYSRRMVDDEKKRVEGQESGKRGGNPALKSGARPLTPTVKGNRYPQQAPHTLKLRTQNPEPRHNKDRQRERDGAPSLDEVKQEVLRLKLPESEAERFWHWCERRDWTERGKPLKWKSALATWRPKSRRSTAAKIVKPKRKPGEF